MIWSIMKILQVFDLLSHSYGGGTVDVMAVLSKELLKRGHQVTICTTNYKYDKEYAESLKGVEIKLLRNWFNLGGYYYAPDADTIDVTQYDVLHLHCFRSMINEVLCSAARKHKIPYIIDAHGSTIKGNGLMKVLKTIYDKVDGNRILSGASRLIAETEVGIKEYKQLGVNEDKISVVHPPLDMSGYSSIPDRGKFRKSHGINNEKIILYVGRITPIKGLEYLIKTIYDLYKIRKDIILVIVGRDNNGYKEHLEELVHDLKLSNAVMFTGYLEGKNKLSALVDADVLVQPSLHEQGARPGFEAILCNTPIIVTKNTGAGEDVSRIDGGVLVEYGNIGELLVAIQYILGNPPEIKDKTQKAKQWIIDNLSLEKQIDKYEQLYKEVVLDGNK